MRSNVRNSTTLTFNLPLVHRLSRSSHMTCVHLARKCIDYLSFSSHHICSAQVEFLTPWIWKMHVG